MSVESCERNVVLRAQVLLEVSAVKDMAVIPAIQVRTSLYSFAQKAGGGRSGGGVQL